MLHRSCNRRGMQDLVWISSATAGGARQALKSATLDQRLISTHGEKGNCWKIPAASRRYDCTAFNSLDEFLRVEENRQVDFNSQGIIAVLSWACCSMTRTIFPFHSIPPRPHSLLCSQASLLLVLQMLLNRTS